ncbi:sporulation membrane protein YtaF [Aureibacillus halotolerans]|uniref:Putative sporulation protein YtaF n=1 Tax=Aureibacillus halotolerans TaxID=1508390 RepID=A0A4R6TYW2_9BACI|nr:sporulation membrane protein YtaF [Aureibacillus halotolerans]TDQ39150.1 putative sporulation protein YtaF [Aureibacillus halotolerans]
MSSLFFLSLLAFAVSLDGFAVGFTYGVRGIRVPLLALVIISLCSALTFLMAMQFGTFIEQFLSVEVAESMGGWLLICIGMWVLIQMIISSFSNRTHSAAENGGPKQLLHVVKSPSSADMDASGHISGTEAVFLGIALSLDALGAGISAAFLSFSPVWMTLAIVLSSLLCLRSGIWLGHTMSNPRLMRAFSVFPSVMLIMIGLWKV